MTKFRANQKQANILMCGDSNYFQHIATFLASLAENNPLLSLNVVVLATKPQAKPREWLVASAARYGNLSLCIEDFDSANLDGLPLACGYPAEIYARFWVAEYFNENVDRVIYLDGDMIALASIEPLVTLDFGGNILAAVPIPGSTRAAMLGIGQDYDYFNSGVMVINLKKWREVKAKDLLLSAATSLEGRLIDPDQDVLNYCFHNQFLRLDHTWNAITPFFKEINELPFNKAQRLAVASNAKIVHFNGTSKPWQYLCMHPHAKDYIKYIKKTEWRAFKPTDRTFLNFIKRQVLKNLGEETTQKIARIFRLLFPKKQETP